MFQKLKEKTEHVKYRQDRYKTDKNQSLRDKICASEIKNKLDWIKYKLDTS